MGNLNLGSSDNSGTSNVKSPEKKYIVLWDGKTLPEEKPVVTLEEAFTIIKEDQEDNDTVFDEYTIVEVSAEYRMKVSFTIEEKI